ncbi:MAG: hypothetical protein M3P43_04835, partial [Actinomycetota bacterium]|nr:hypothetical protein [Actinomycetota bacterium]
MDADAVDEREDPQRDPSDLEQTERGDDQPSHLGMDLRENLGGHDLEHLEVVVQLVVQEDA